MNQWRHSCLTWRHQQDHGTARSHQKLYGEGWKHCLKLSWRSDPSEKSWSRACEPESSRCLKHQVPPDPCEYLPTNSLSKWYTLEESWRTDLLTRSTCDLLWRSKEWTCLPSSQWCWIKPKSHTRQHQPEATSRDWTRCLLPQQRHPSNLQSCWVWQAASIHQIFYRVHWHPRLSSSHPLWTLPCHWVSGYLSWVLLPCHQFLGVSQLKQDVRNSRRIHLEVLAPHSVDSPQRIAKQKGFTFVS